LKDIWHHQIESGIPVQNKGMTILRKTKDQDLNYLWELISENHEWKKYDVCQNSCSYLSRTIQSNTDVPQFRAIAKLMDIWPGNIVGDSAHPVAVLNGGYER